MICDHDTIAAPATAAGGALAVIRVSGSDALTICDRIFRGSAPLADAGGYTVHYGHIMADGRTLDDVLVTVFRAPRSYTGEDAAEISCHGSQYIVSETLRLLTAAGARMAQPGEFTIRAYLAGKLDLSQAEAVADIIASSSRASHALAANQMRGGYSEAFDTLREKLLHLTSLLELELDFSEEEVEFADRTQLRDTMRQIKERIDALRSSFSLGNAIKEGVAVAIVGAPNVGKSTLLNRLLNEERAMVSDIAGTTRDVIEERANIDGVVFRFLDTAGIRSTNDTLEQMGIARRKPFIRTNGPEIRSCGSERRFGCRHPKPGLSAPSRPNAADGIQQNRQNAPICTSRRRRRHLGTQRRRHRRPAPDPARRGRYGSALPRRHGHLQQPPLRSPDVGVRSPECRPRRPARQPSDRSAERRDPSGHPPSERRHRAGHRPGRGPQNHILEVLHRQIIKNKPGPTSDQKVSVSSLYRMDKKSTERVLSILPAKMRHTSIASSGREGIGAEFG